MSDTNMKYIYDIVPTKKESTKIIGTIFSETNRIIDLRYSNLAIKDRGHKSWLKYTDQFTRHEPLDITNGFKTIYINKKEIKTETDITGGKDWIKGNFKCNCDQ